MPPASAQAAGGGAAAQVGNQVCVVYQNMFGQSEGPCLAVANMTRELSNTITFISETWSAERTITSCSRHSSYIAHAIPIPRTTGAVRRSGGVMAFAAPNIKHTITNTHVTHFSVSIRLPCGWIHGLYLPPTVFNSHTTRQFLDSLPTPTALILGDVNITINDLATNTNTGPRGTSIREYTAMYGLHHIPPSQAQNPFNELGQAARPIRNRHLTRTWMRGEDINHHAWSSMPRTRLAFLVDKRGMRTQKGAIQGATRSDHPTMLLTFEQPPPPGTQTGDSSPLPRFSLKLLREDSTAKERLTRVFEQYAEAKGIVHQAERLFSQTHIRLFFNTQDPQERTRKLQTLIDNLDRQITEAIQYAARNVLGTYDPTTAPNRPNRLLRADAPECRSMDQARRIGKMTMRGVRGTCNIASPDPDKSPQEHVHTHYTVIFTPSPATGQTTSTRFAHMVWGPDTRHSAAEAFLRSDIYWAIHKYPTERTGGEDGIHVLMLRALCHQRLSLLTTLLHCLFRVCGACGLTPKRWNSSIISLIPKTKPPTTDIKDYRPISLTVMARRIFESCLHRFMQRRWDDSREWGWLRLNSAQGGFRRGFSCVTHAITASESPSRYHIFLDIKAAYDRVGLKILWAKLQARRTPARIASLFQSLFEGCSSTIVVNGIRTEPVERRCGLMQGSILSPMLFNIYINDLLDDLKAAYTIDQQLNPASSLLIADDIKAQANTREEIQEAAIICNRWAVTNGMLWGHAKCGIIGLQPEEEDIMLGDQPIPRVDTYKYVGFPFTARGIDWHAHAQHLLTQGRKVLTALKAIPIRMVEGIRAEMWRTFGRSTTEYGAGPIHIWIKQAARSPDPDIRAQAKAVKAAFCALQKDTLGWVLSPKAVSKALVPAEALVNLPPFQFRQEEIAWRTHEHITRTNPTNPIRRVQHHRSMLALFQPNLAQITQTPAHNIIPALERLKLVKLWKTTREQDPDITTRTFGRARRAKLWGTASKQLNAGAIRPGARRYAFMCPSTLLPDKNTRLAAIRWRIGQTFHWTCRAVGCPSDHTKHKGLRRRCVNAQNHRLLHLLTLADTHIDHERSGLHKRVPPDIIYTRYTHAHRDWATMPAHVHEKYSILDHLLNTGQFTVFKFILDKLALNVDDPPRG